jgi:hypothetical protein
MMSSQTLNTPLGEKPWKKHFLQGFFFTFLLWVTLPAFSFPIAAHSDANIRLMLNHFWASDWQSFESLIFSQGPLAFLQYPLPIKNNLLWAQSLGFLARVFLFIGLYHLYPPRKKYKLISVGMAYLLISCLAGHHLIYLATLLVCVLAALEKNRSWLMFATFWAVLNWHIRLAPGLIGLAVVAYTFGHFLIDKPKNKALWFWLCFWLLALFFSTFLLKPSMSQVLELWEGYFHMTFNSPNLVPGTPASKLVILGVALASALLIFTVKRRLLKTLGVPLALILTLATIYFSGRAGQGPFLVLLRIVSICSALVVLIQPLDRKVILGLSSSLVLFGALGYKTFSLKSWPYTKPKPLRATQQLLNPTLYAAQWEREMAKWQIDLPPVTCEELVIYPWNFIPFYQEGYGLKALPSLQGYLGFIPFLEKANLDHLRSLPKNTCLLFHQPSLNTNTNLAKSNVGPFLTLPPRTKAFIAKHFRYGYTINTNYAVYLKN